MSHYLVVTAMGVVIGSLFNHMIIFYPSPGITQTPASVHSHQHMFALIIVGAGLGMAGITEHIILIRHRLALASVVRDVDDLYALLRCLVSEEGIVPQAQAMSVQRIDLYRMEKFLIASRSVASRSQLTISFLPDSDLRHHVPGGW